MKTLLRRHIDRDLQRLDRHVQAFARQLADFMQIEILNRNETQHQDQVRSESIRPAVLILFDIAIDFLVRLQPGTTTWVSGENYDWLKRYGIRNPRRIHMSEEIRPRIAKKLRSGYLLMRKESPPL